jgi:anti-sigma factor RsiW
MKCKLVKKIIPVYIEGTLSPKRSQQLELHIDDCPHCQKELQTFEETIHHASSLPVEYPTPEAWKAFWPTLRVRISQSEAFEENRLLLWVRMHGWKIAGVACVLALLLSFWGLSNSRLFKGSTDNPTFDALISSSFMAEIPVDQLREQVNHELQRLDVPLVWDNRTSLIDEIRLPNSEASTDLVNQWFHVITSEIDVESVGNEVFTDAIPSTTDRIDFVTLD